MMWSLLSVTSGQMTSLLCAQSRFAACPEPGVAQLVFRYRQQASNSPTATGAILLRFIQAVVSNNEWFSFCCV